MPHMLPRIVAAIGLLATLGGCAASAPDQAPKDIRPEQLPKMTLDCIFIRSIDDWKVLDDYHLLIYAPTRKTAYHIELETYCHALQSAEHLGISSHQDGRVCSFGGDALLVGDQRCTIGAIRPYQTGGEPESGAGENQRNDN